MKVLKFGGTSVGSTEMLRKVASIVSHRSEDSNLIVVVSAFSGVTNVLEDIAHKAVSEDVSMHAEEIAQRHVSVATDLISNPTSRSLVIHKIQGLVSDLTDLCKGVSLLGELTSRTRARMLTAGELLSSYIVTAFFQDLALDAAGIDSRDYFVTSGDNLAGRVDVNTTFERLSGVPDIARIVVMPGFIARDVNGYSSTLGRGGSDLTAALVAAAISATELEIWTDVNGVLTADPRLVTGSHAIDSLSYEEAMELSHFGAKVIYPPTMQPLIKARVPLVIKNTMNPDHPGTRISEMAGDGQNVVKGISSISDITLLTVAGPGMIGVPGTAMRLFSALARKELNILFITQSSSEHTITIGIRDVDTQQALQELSAEFERELYHGIIDTISAEPGLALIAAVGEGMKHRPGVAGKLFGLLGENGVNIRAIAQGSTERNVSLVVRNGDVAKALNVLHEGFFLSPVKVAHIFAVGVGNVGSEMLRQLAVQQETLKAEQNVELRLAGVSNSRKLVLDQEGIDLGSWQDRLEQGEDYLAEELPAKIAGLNLRNSILIDNTGSPRIASLYADVLARNMHVVTSNKIAASSDFEQFLSTVGAARKGGVKFLYETNVAAGLPVLSTIRDLILTGDRIHRIEAVLSGSLNYIFNTVAAECPFSLAVAKAREMGLTEPDPGIDLSGLDVKRKMLILARQAGYRMELEDVMTGLLIPEGVTPGSDWQDLLGKISALDQEIEKQRLQLETNGRKWRFVASFDRGTAEVGVREIDKEHPAWILDGKDNLVLIHSDRYMDQPLVIKGAGAGPDVTAGGVLSDVLRIVNG